MNFVVVFEQSTNDTLSTTRINPRNYVGICIHLVSGVSLSAASIRRRILAFVSAAIPPRSLLVRSQFATTIFPFEKDALTAFAPVGKEPKSRRKKVEQPISLRSVIMAASAARAMHRFLIRWRREPMRCDLLSKYLQMRSYDLRAASVVSTGIETETVTEVSGGCVPL
jgi:hypothetical protein